MIPIRFRSALCSAVALGLLAACSTTKEADPTPASSMSWTVDGSTVTASSFQSQTASTTIDATGVANPSQANNTRVSLSIPAAVGTYTFGPTASAAGTYVVASGSSSSAVYYAGAGAVAGTVTGGGTIVVTAISAASVTGTFTFTGIDRNTGAAKSITNGAFALLR